MKTKRVVNLETHVLSCDHAGCEERLEDLAQSWLLDRAEEEGWQTGEIDLCPKHREPREP